MSSQHKIHLYRQFEAIYKTPVGYIVSVTCQIRQLGTLKYKKHSYVTVLSGSKIAIYYPGSEQQRRWSDCTDAQADLLLCCSPMA